jgi:hypothetical protein
MNPFERFFFYYASQPVPRQLDELFAITKKKDLEKYVQTLRISKKDLVTLTHTCQKIGYYHFIEYGDWVPAHLKPTEEEKTAFRGAGVGKLDGKAAKFVSKIANTFKERSYRVGHLFVGHQRWHLLFLELRDLKEEGNHWAAGPHIHFTNDLCSPLGIDDVSKKFTTLDFDMGERLHIKWVNKSSVPTPASITPAAGAPVAPPPGAADL